jgi:16S rRNA (cytidine1402-2'-O)-methyltransferase
MMREFPFYLVSTPIGNLSDLSRRAEEILASVDFILAEDTRKARTLLTRYGIAARTIPYHDHNKEKATPGILDRIEGGETGALVTDAGTPGISDPGFYIVRALIERGIEFTALPGPSAVMQALVLSGLPTDRFTFYGYVPRKKGARDRLFEEAGAAVGTAVFFESPHRIVSTLEALAGLLPDRQTVVARELTKLHEEMARGSAKELAGRFAGRRVRGEVTLLIRGEGKRGRGGTA